MAISAVHYQLLKEHAPLLVHGGSLLEIGEANWYGDMDPREILEDWSMSGKLRSANLKNGARSLIASGNLFQIAKLVYKILFEPIVVTSVDMNGSSTAICQDLNGPLTLWEDAYDISINHGTAEHIFNIGMVFKSMHDYTKLGGIMIHECPFTGWIDHGFYCLQPTLFYDLAAANEYEMVSLSITHIESRTIIRVESREHFHTMAGDVPQNAMLFVVMRKVVDAPFRVPMQGVYDGRLSEKGRRVWQTAR